MDERRRGPHARPSHGLSRQQLADAVRVHYQTVGYLERAQYSPSLALALRITRLLDTPVEQLFSLDPIDTRQPLPDHRKDRRPGRCAAARHAAGARAGGSDSIDGIMRDTRYDRLRGQHAR